jgi:hypothetical protein
MLYSPSPNDGNANVLYLSAILALLQVDSSYSDPLIRSCALMSLICALMSLLYACIYIVRFTVMRQAHKALEWAEVSVGFHPL